MGKTKKKCRKERTSEISKKIEVSKMVLMDDVLFEVFAEDTDACEELLQVALQDTKLRINKDTLVPQKTFSVIKNRSIRVDCCVNDGENDSKTYNIEIQKSNNTDHVRRARYNGSVITVKKSEPGDTFCDIQDVHVIYVSSFDVFGKGKAVYHVEPCIAETGELIDDGFHRMFINTTVKEDSQISRYFRHFMETEFMDDEFPKTSERMWMIKHDKREVAHVCEVVEEYAKLTNKRDRIISFIEGAKKYASKDVVLLDVMEEFQISKKEAKAYYDET